MAHRSNLLLQWTSCLVAGAAASLATAATPVRNVVPAENIFYTQLRVVKRFHGFNEFINTADPTNGVFIKKYKRLTWDGSVKESNNTTFPGTQRTDFTGDAVFEGAVMTNSLFRREYRNLDDPSNEGDGTGGEYIVVGDGGGGCYPPNRFNLLNVAQGQPGSTLPVIDQTTIVNATRRETTGTMGIQWSRVHLPCNLFDFQTFGTVFQSRGPMVETLSEPAEEIIVTDTRTEGYFANPTAALTFRMENNSPWTPLATTPGILEDVAWECLLQFRAAECCPGRQDYVAVLQVEVKQGSAAPTIEERRVQVRADPSRTGLEGELEARLELRAERVGQTLRILSAALEVDGAACANCSDGPGSAGVTLGSVNWAMDLGLLPGGFSAGSLRVKSEVWTPALYTPASLIFTPPGSGNVAQRILRRADNTLRQIRTGVYLVDIVTSAEDPSLPASSYEVRFHSQAGSTPAAADPAIHEPASAALYRTRFSDPDGAGNRLFIARHALSPSMHAEYSYDAATNTWSLTEDGIRRTDRTVTALSPTEDEELTTVWDLAPTGPVKVAESIERFRRYVVNGLSNRVLYQRVLDPAGAALTTTWTYAVESNRLRLLQTDSHNGTWEKSTYHLSAGLNGEITRVYFTASPFVNSGPTSSTSEHRRFAEAESPVADRDADGRRDTQGERYEFIGGIFSAVRTYRLTKLVTFNGQLCSVTEVAQLRAPSYSSSDPSLRWERRLTYATGPFAGRLAYVRRPDLTIQTTTYSLDAATGRTTEVRAEGAPDASQLAVVDGTLTTTLTDVDGRLVSSLTEDVASGLPVDSRQVLNRDPYGRPTVVRHHDGALEQLVYSPCCGMIESTTLRGETTSYTYDALRRRITETRAGLTLVYTYDALDRIVKTVRRGSDGSEIVLSTAKFDLAGRLVEQRDSRDRLTIFAEVYNPDRTTTRTTTFPDQGVLVEVTNADGSPASTTGSAAAAASYHEHATGATSTIPCVVTTSYRGAPGTSPTEWTKTYVDGIGRILRVEFPDGAAASTEYDLANRVSAQVDPDGVATRLAYNARGEQEVTALDVDRDGVVDFDGTDRITRTRASVAMRDGQVVRRVTTEAWETDGTDSPTAVSISEQSTDGLRTWQTVRGLTTSSVTTFDGSGGRTVVTTAPDGTVTTQVFADELLQSLVTSHPSLGTLGSSTYQYDVHNRLETATDARTGTTSYSYFGDDQVYTVTTPDPDTTQSGYGYDPQTTTFGYDSAGRQNSVIHPDGGVVTTEYFPTGQVKKISGARTYPVEYTYDPQGRMKTLKTWQNHAGNSGIANTTWNYHAQRGWLENKRYQDNTGPSYSYTAGGRLHTRTWARGVTTTYTHNPAGDLANVVYSDTTPDVGITYDRLGRPKAITDAAGTRTLTYHSSGQLEDESYATGLLDGFAIDRSFDGFHRLSGVSVPSAISAGYSYDAASRLQVVTSGVNTATYGYIANSPLVESVTFKNNGATRLTTVKAFDSLNRLTSITNTPPSTSTSSFNYKYNSANQRTRVTRENSAYWQFGYDALGQVTAGKKYLADTTPINGLDFAWTFDDIGNRETSVTNGQASSYSANPLNQYESRTVPGVIDVFGAAQPDATVTVTHPAGSMNILSTTRQGAQFYRQLTADNSTGPVYQDIMITGVKNNVGATGEDAVTEVTREVFVPPTQQAFVHDADGNLTADSRWEYSWDGENRLVAIETSQLAADAGVARRRIEFTYDGQSRRIAKQVLAWDASTSAWLNESSIRFVYDGWDLLAELDPTGAALRTYTWGLDLSGSMQGAGGVGGLLFAGFQLQPSISTYAPAYDGNGNVIGNVDMATGAKSAEYEYGAFGETLKSDGPMAESNTFRFSSKYTEVETGWLYYGYRFYDPYRGRWLSRDPIEELGGVNIYNLTRNDSINRVDLLGLYPGLDDHGEPISPGLSVELISAIQLNADVESKRESTRVRLGYIIPIYPSSNPKGINTDSGNKFVYTCKYGWVDMGHFFRNANATYKLSAADAAVGSYLNEVLQAIGRSDSAWGVEDLSSNALGRTFGRALKKAKKPDIALQWQRFLKSAGAVAWDSEVEKLINADLAAYKALSVRPTARSMEEGIKWHRSQELWKCLCEGDRPKHEKHRY